MIGAITNDGNPINVTTNTLTTASIQVPLLYPANIPRLPPIKEENINAGTVIKSVHFNGIKKNAGIDVDSPPCGTYILPNVPLKTSPIYLPNLTSIGSFNPAFSANSAAFSGSPPENGFFENEATKR
jgi:hypothetical protein